MLDFDKNPTVGHRCPTWGERAVFMLNLVPLGQRKPRSSKITCESCTFQGADRLPGRPHRG